MFQQQIDFKVRVRARLRDYVDNILAQMFGIYSEQGNRICIYIYIYSCLRIVHTQSKHIIQLCAARSTSI